MSNVSSAHTVNKFVAGKSEALTGQRLAKVGYKSTKNQAAKYPSICVSVPMIQTEEITQNVALLIPAVREFLAGVQDQVIRSLYESADGNMTQILDSEISVTQCVSFLAAQADGGRLTKEYLESWFDSEMAENLSVVVAQKLKFDDLTPENLPVVEKHVGVYRGMLSSLAGGKTLLSDEKVNACKKAIQLSGVDDETSEKLIQRLDKMLVKEKIEDMLEL